MYIDETHMSFPAKCKRPQPMRTRRAFSYFIHFSSERIFSCSRRLQFSFHHQFSTNISSGRWHANKWSEKKRKINVNSSIEFSFRSISVFNLIFGPCFGPVPVKSWRQTNLNSCIISLWNSRANEKYVKSDSGCVRWKLAYNACSDPDRID